MQRILREVGAFILGKRGDIGGSTPVESVGNLAKSPFRRSFAKLSSRNKKVALYKDYTETYFQRKQEEYGSPMFWLINSGKLFKDTVENATINATPTTLTITASDGDSSDYQATHQFGDTKRNIPARPPYALDKTDKNSIESFIQNRFLALFKSKATVATS